MTSKLEEVAEAIRVEYLRVFGAMSNGLAKRMARAAIEAAEKWEVEQIRALMGSTAPWDEPTVLCGRPEDLRERWKDHE